MTTPDVLEAAKPWMEPCGSCDMGMLAGCNCPEGDPRVVISRLAQEIQCLRKRLDSAHDALTRVTEADDDAFTTLESTVDWVVSSYRATSEEHDRLWSIVARLHSIAAAARSGGVSLDPAEVLAALEGQPAGDAA